MNNPIEEVKTTYKPYRFTKKKNVTIIDSTTGSFVIKEKKDNKVKDVYNYLISRNFDYFPKLEEETRNDINIFQYIEEIKEPKEQKASDLIDLVSLLHNKTTYYKEITEDKYKEIYDNLKNNILYTKNYYDNLYNIMIEEVYPSPSNYLLLRNIYKIFSALDYTEDSLDNWYDNTKNDLKIRVALIHNNLETEHFIKGDRDYLVSWEKAKLDSPILDLITFYQKEYFSLDFKTLLERYLKKYPLSTNELDLFLIVISIPPIINITDNIWESTKEIRKKLDYIFKTEELVSNLKSNNSLDK